MLENKKIILGVTGGIAAYKTAILTRLLIKRGCDVKIIMTEHAKKFITPLTLSTLSKNPILVEFFNPENGAWNSHVDLGLWADAFIIAPATANTIGKMANGIADNLLVTTYLSARCPVFIAPAMDLDMYQHPTTAQNIEKLKSFGNVIIEPSSGELASGLEGKGRMEEPENIIQTLNSYFAFDKEIKKAIAGKKILITAGPTREAIDPVRFISNHSSGKMGYALAQILDSMGATVTLISGPVSNQQVGKHTCLHKITTAQEMLHLCQENIKDVDVAIFAAAVADYKPEMVDDNKIKSKSEKLNISLIKNPDIAKTLAQNKQPRQIFIGFALETEREIENAKEKLQNKKLDFIVLNSLNDSGAGFNTETNKITIIDKHNNIDKFELKSKHDVAIDIVNKLLTLL